MDIILASGSPRRRELLEMLGLEFEVRPARGGEHPPEHAGPEEIVLALAGDKAAEVAEHCAPENVIIAADTIVWLEGELLGKPRSEEDAARMLRELSGRSHEVWTGVCVLRGGEKLLGAERTLVRFRRLEESEILAYIATGEPMDKAGSYGIQGIGGLYVREIHGDYNNVVGLPIARLYHELQK